MRLCRFTNIWQTIADPYHRGSLMTNSVSTTPDDIPDINAALGALVPVLRRANLTGWAMMGGIAVAAIGVIWLVKDRAEKPFVLAVTVLFLAAIIMGWVVQYVRKRHEAQIMPILAETAGLSYEQNGNWYLTALPDRLLPKGVRHCEDLLTGKIGGRAVRFAEAKIETGGKNSSILFQGIVLEFQNGLPMPAFFLADEAQTRGWFVFKGNIRVDDLAQVQSVTGPSGATYGVWAADHGAGRQSGFAAFVKALTELERQVGYEAKLYTASSDGKRTFLAVRHSRDLFRIGGMFTAAEERAADIRRAYSDLTMPMRIVSALLKAEGEVAQSAEKQPDAAAGPA
jgi:hypothetical protein